MSYTKRFFPNGKITRKAFQAAETAARLELETIQERFRRLGWSECVGSSGTIRAVATALEREGWTDGAITRAGVKTLRKRMIECGSVSGLDLPSLTEDRAPVFAGGVAILRAVVEGMGIESMGTTRAALREGVLYDLLGRIRREDVRDRTIRALCERYHVDLEQAERVEATALSCLDQVAEGWELERVFGGQLLAWAARTHEIGLAIAYAGHHRHSAYILTHSTMPGFSRGEQERLAAIVRNHRRKLSRDPFAEVSGPWRESILRLCLLLRLAVRLNRTRSPEPIPEFRLKTDQRELEITLPADWLDAHPLTSADLAEEAQLLAHADVSLRVRSGAAS